MSKIQYLNLKFKSAANRIIEQVNVILDEYDLQGYQLTQRQVYYQFIARDLFAEDRKFTQVGGKWVRDKNGKKNALPNYKMLCAIITDARRAGLVDWDAIVDRTRYLRKDASWNSPADIIATCARQFRLDLWQSQDHYAEVWFEKDALLGIFERAAETYRLPLYSCRGYGSDSEAHNAARRFIAKQEEGKKCLILHFGDHDPSGMDMTRDIQDRFEMFGANVRLKRMALNMDQVEKYNPPPNPAKNTDSRYVEYEKEFGDESWELDALNPDVLVGLVTNAIERVVDGEAWASMAQDEEKHRFQLALVSQKWNSVTKMVERVRKPKKKK